MNTHDLYIDDDPSVNSCLKCMFQNQHWARKSCEEHFRLGIQHSIPKHTSGKQLHITTLTGSCRNKQRLGKSDWWLAPLIMFILILFHGYIVHHHVSRMLTEGDKYHISPAGGIGSEVGGGAGGGWVEGGWGRGGDHENNRILQQCWEPLYLPSYILWVLGQNGVSWLYNMLEIYHSGPEPSICISVYLHTFI